MASLNLGNASVDDLARLADSGVTVLGLQEGSDRTALFENFLNRPKYASWKMYRPGLDGGPAVPILWDSSVWREEQRRAVLAVGSRYLGPDGAGPVSSKPKVITAVVLEHRDSGRFLRVMNTHLIPSARRTDLSPAETQNRRDHVRDHVAALVDMIGPASEHPMPIAVTGDFNGPGSWTLLDPLTRVGMLGWTGVPTHEAGALDHVIRRNLDTDGTRVVKTGSDHDAVVKELRYRV